MGGWSDDDGGGGATSGHTKAELRNALRQADEVRSIALEAMKTSWVFTVTPALVQRLNFLAVDGVVDEPGVYRRFDKDRPILGSKHQPPPFAEVPTFVERMCSYINEAPPLPFSLRNGDAEMVAAINRAVHVASYALWRVNWIHPFEDGNGRASRALCYLLLCVYTRMVLPGTTALPERIAKEKSKFYGCLDAADQAHKTKGRIRIQQVEGFVRKHFRAQILEYVATLDAPRPR